MPYEPVNIPPLREADTPRKYKLQPRPEKIIKLSSEAQRRLQDAQSNVWWRTEGG